MQIRMCKSKIHRAKVTEANLNYMGSITIDENLINAANIREYEEVLIVNNNNGARFSTYVIRGQRGSGTICLNGAASRMVQVDDIIIILSFASYAQEELNFFKPKLIYVDNNNMIIKNESLVSA